MTILKVPKTLLDRAVSLADVGIEELAWQPDDAREILELIKGTTVAILGGDIYSKRFGRFEPTYENWHVNRDPQEAPGAFAARALDISQSYLEKLKRRGAEELWVVFVFSEPLEPSDV